jgi:hypothetical protein
MPLAEGPPVGNAAAIAGESLVEHHKATEFDTMHDVARFLMANGLVLYHCEYRFSFGSWQVEAGTPHRRLRIVRDGKERTLTCASARVNNAGSIPQWHQEEPVSLDRVSTARQIQDLLGPRLQELTASHWDEDR